MPDKKPVNDCERCQAFDDLTRQLVGQVFGREECASLTVLIAGSISARYKNLKNPKMKFTMAQRIMERKSLDMMAATLSKFVVTFDEEYLQVMRKSLEKIGVTISAEHAKCPHVPKSPTPIVKVDPPLGTNPTPVADLVGGEP